MLGIVMTGGGARGAYQAGVLKRIGRLKSLRKKPSPFKIIAGASAGSVNGAALAVGSQDFALFTAWLSKLWSNLEPGDIYRSDVLSLIPKAGRWLKDLSLGSISGGGHAHSLLDAAPLRKFLAKHLSFEQIQKNINDGYLHSVVIAATDYQTGKTVLFIQGVEGHPVWTKSRRIALSTHLTVDHICASAAIPGVFSPIPLTTALGRTYFGDGCLRLPQPLSPAIRLGAKKLFAIGVRSKKSDLNPIETLYNVRNPPPLAQILGTTLNAIFLDSLDSDVEHLQRLNELIKSGKLTQPPKGTGVEPMEVIDCLSINPSDDIGKLAGNFLDGMPTFVGFMMAGLGTEKSATFDLVSYLLFHSKYMRALIDLGYNDADKRIDEIDEFLNKP